MMWKWFEKKEEGNTGDFLATLMVLLAMTVMVLSYMELTDVVQDKMKISQLARKAILEMETCGYLEHGSEVKLIENLEMLGVTDIELQGTTMEEIGYGETIAIQIRGKIKGTYGFQESRVSTAKN